MSETFPEVDEIEVTKGTGLEAEWMVMGSSQSGW
jgi:hypothetical protein